MYVSVEMPMRRVFAFSSFVVGLVISITPIALTPIAVMSIAMPAAAQDAVQKPLLPYTPSLDVTSMDTSADPCQDFYRYSCGGWQKHNPLPADQSSWSVYGKLYQDNLFFLRGILEQAGSEKSNRDLITQQIGDFYAACMDEARADAKGIAPIKDNLDAIAHLKSAPQMA